MKMKDRGKRNNKCIIGGGGVKTKKNARCKYERLGKGKDNFRRWGGGSGACRCKLTSVSFILLGKLSFSDAEMLAAGVHSYTVTHRLSDS